MANTVQHTSIVAIVPSSSDGSLMKNTVDYAKLAEERAATVAALERRLADLQVEKSTNNSNIRMNE